MPTEVTPGFPPDDEIAGALGLNDNKSPFRGWLLWLLVISIIAGAGTYYYLYSLPKNRAAPRYHYATATVSRGDLVIKVSATGTLQPVNQVDVGSELSGTIRTVEVDYNDKVHKGQVLAYLDTDQLEARVLHSRAAYQIAKARLQEAEATLLETEVKLKRCRELFKRALCTRQELDTDLAAYKRAKAARSIARAQITQAEAALNSDETNLKKAVIKSPIDGMVLSRDIEPGQTVAASFQTPVLFTLAEDLGRMLLHVNIDEADIGQVREGMKATFTVDAYPERRFPATITEVRFDPQDEDGVVTYEALLKVDNRELLLRPGMTATADIITRRVEDALLLPNGTLRFSPPPSGERPANRRRSILAASTPWHGRSSQRKKKSSPAKGRGKVWTLNNGSPRPVPVRLGLTDGRNTELLEGDLQEGQDLITDAIPTP